MMAASPIWAASAASPSIRIMPGRNGVSAKRGAVSSERRRRSRPVPPTSTIPMNAAARPMRSASRPPLTPPATSPTAMATISMASTSSITAAPRMIRPERVESAPNAESARELIATEVAVRAAAKKMRPSTDRPSRLPVR